MVHKSLVASSANIVRALILGAPGSGKGTISDRIVKEFGFKHLACGDVLRQNQLEGTPLGLDASKYVVQGQLVPDHLVTKCILQKIGALPFDLPWLLDGYPRTIPQANSLHAAYPVNVVLNLAVPHDVIIERLKSRWVHLTSGRVYNTGFNCPRVPGIDDLTGEELVQREDDKPETIRHRLEVYEHYTRPLVDYYSERNVLKTFAGSTTNAIWPKVQEFLHAKINDN